MFDFGKKYPPVSYNFSVSIGFALLKEDTLFSEISGISSEMDVEEVKEGGRNDWVYHLPKGTKGSRITLKRGLATITSELIMWCFSSINMSGGRVDTRTVVISLMDRNKVFPRTIWVFYNAMPVKWNMSDFNASESNIAIESIELAFSKMEIMPLL